MVKHIFHNIHDFILHFFDIFSEYAFVATDVKRVANRLGRIAVFLAHIVENAAERDVLVDDVGFIGVELDDVDSRIDIAATVREKFLA